MLNLFSIPKVSCYFDNFPPKKTISGRSTSELATTFYHIPKMLLNIETHIIGGFIGYLDLHHLETYSIPNFGFESLILFIYIYIYLSLSPQSELGGVHAPFSKETGRFTRKYQENIYASSGYKDPCSMESPFRVFAHFRHVASPSPQPQPRTARPTLLEPKCPDRNLRRLQTSQSAYVYIYVYNTHKYKHTLYTYTHVCIYIYKSWQ